MRSLFAFQIVQKFISPIFPLNTPPCGVFIDRNDVIFRFYKSISKNRNIFERDILPNL